MRKAISALLAPAVLCGFTIVLSGCTDESGVKTETTIKTPEGTTRQRSETTIDKKGENPPLAPAEKKN